MIGWVKLKAAPGIWERRSLEYCSMRSALVLPAFHVSYGFKATNSSLRLGPYGSVPESFRPVCELTRETSSALPRIPRTLPAISDDLESEMPAGRLARTQ